MGGLEQYSDTYEILEKLGEGSGGIVYKAYHKRLRKEVVLKKVRGGGASRMISRQEVDILKHLNHSSLPQVLDFLTVGEDVYTVMSYIPGRSFQELMDGGVKFTQNQLIRFAMQLCSALEYLHGQTPPVIHSDIKPANVMLKPDGDICLIDFNISFFLDGSTVLGYSHGYTSPEQYIYALDSQSVREMKNYGKIDEKTDIYSVGAMFYYLATGRKRTDFREPVDKALLEAYTSDAFVQVICRAMEIDPAKRYKSAGDMFRAFQGIGKRDRRYRNLLRKQRGIRILFVFLTGGFVILGGFGVYTMRAERVDTYNGLVREQIQQIEDGDYEKAEEKYEEARKVLPSSIETYYQNAYALYQQKKYEECIAFIDYDILENDRMSPGHSKTAEVFYLKGDCCFLLEEYGEAVNAYERTVEAGGRKPVYYRDYAIALAYNQEKEKAEEVLEKAVELGLKEDSVYYAKGEIEKALEKYDDALKDFRECISVSENADLKERAYILSSKIYELQKLRLKEHDILLEALAELPEENQMILLERLIQADIDLAGKEGLEKYRKEAEDNLLKVIDRGWDTYETYDTLAVLYEKQKELDKAWEILLEMQNKFGEDYNIYKRYAFLETDRQELLPNLSRDYSMFAKYYEQAVELYEEETDNDKEMQLLKQVYAQVKEGGWL